MIRQLILMMKFVTNLLIWWCCLSNVSDKFALIIIWFRLYLFSFQLLQTLAGRPSHGYDQIMQVRKLDDIFRVGTCFLQTWRRRERMKTVSVAPVISLNVGVDPQTWPSPVPDKECWVDPLSLNPQVGGHGRWQSRARYRQSLDPTVEEVRRLASGLWPQEQAGRPKGSLFRDLDL